ncbi:hypothetical protein Rhe02_42470 [Rhizocola hellebori]|uniref:Carrier domain-containing protein n=1 Tax=Rhizocola hellebori TaxID=1392758 RepID=A0A8J3Q937_9ACTN|nr:class I adenylate-forming enzyme family protein [Rhizocola hellebori]GIH06180.1 hypothetical protein Rhe02_42470 [Rhizocola hellebori]
MPALLSARAAAEPDHVALLVDGEHRLTAAQWQARASAAAQDLTAQGVHHGDRVGLVFSSWIDYAIAFVAVTSIGAVAVPLSASLPPARVREALAHCGARLTLRSVPATGSSRPLGLAVSPGELAQIIYTSGTTGTPKGVSATHANLTFGLGRLEHSRYFLHAFPLGTNAAQTMLMTALVARPTSIVQSRFDAPGFARLVSGFGVSSIFLVPAMAVALLDGGHPLDEVELIASSAAPLPPAVAQRLSAAYPEATLINTYTSTEAAPAFTTMIYDPSRPDAIGRPSGDIRVDPTGQVWLRSPTKPRSYYGDAMATEATFQDGWVRMGDVGYLDPDGYLYLTDRDADVVKSGAHKVSTLRIEHALYEHPSVVEAAVVGLPHPVMGATLGAAVVTRASFDVRAFLALRLAPHELPTRVLTLDSLPRNDSGKILKRSLRALFEARPRSLPPQTPAELAVAAAWQQLLNVSEIGLADDFFALGGDSLSATRLAALLDVPVSQIFATPTLASLATALPTPASAPAPSARGVGAAGGVELTATQESLLAWMYAGEQTRDAGPISVGIRVRDGFDADRFGWALGEVVRGHEALRMVFDGRTPRILEHCPPEVTVTEAGGVQEGAQLLRSDREGRFDLRNGPLVRSAVVRLGEEDHLIGLAVHHLVFDGASMGVLLHELGLAYSGSPLRPRGDYREYVTWTRQQWRGNLPYWESTLDGAPSHLDPFRGRQVAKRMRSAQLELDLGEAKPLRDKAARHGATMFMALAAAWSAVLTRASGLTDIVLLTPVPGRAKPGSEALIGCLVQSMLLRVDTGDDPGFPDLLARVRRAALGGLDHQFHPFATFYDRHPGASFLRVENWAGQAHLPGLVSEQFDLPRALDAEWPTPDGGPDLQAPELAVVEQPDGRLTAWLLWNDYAFDRSTMESIARMLTDYVGKELR